MSRSIARSLNAIVMAVTSPQNPARRTATIARLMEHLDAASAATITTAKGPLRVLPHRGPHLAAAALNFDEEEPETLAWIDSIPAEETLWDIGAATGLLSMYAALTPGAKIYAFEPKATSFGVLVEHLALNNMGERIFPLCVALSDETALTHLSLNAMAAGSGGNSVAGYPNQFGEFKSVFDQGALAYRVDDFIKAFKIPAPHHIKIDVDGAEGAILRGAPKTLKSVKSVLIEVEGENADQAATRIDEPLLAAGLVEDTSLRAMGSKRNRLYRRG
jgi:FkbM family methyltransferase